MVHPPLSISSTTSTPTPCKKPSANTTLNSNLSPRTPTAVTPQNVQSAHSKITFAQDSLLDTLNLPPRNGSTSPPRSSSLSTYSDIPAQTQDFPPTHPSTGNLTSTLLPLILLTTNYYSNNHPPPDLPSPNMRSKDGTLALPSTITAVTTATSPQQHPPGTRTR